MKRTLKRRRLENKTDYKTRLALLMSEKPRLIIRKTNRYIVVQIVTSSSAQDSVLINMNSKILLENGWPKENAGSLKSLPAAYLTGFFLGRKAKEKIKEAIIDIGMHRNISNSRICAVIKGAIDAGLKIPYKEEMLPSLDYIKKNKKVGFLMDKIKTV